LKGKIKIDVTNKNEAMFVTLLSSILVPNEEISKNLVELAEKYEGWIGNKDLEKIKRYVELTIQVLRFLGK
tara:strand:+ start:430 stop:642 length:213 start_codon:yes stop_codon:yes gene_type:complete